jgi:hypothetical protein
MYQRRLAIVTALLLSAARGHAADQAIDAVKLVLKKTATKEALLFVSKDPDFLFPPVGSADDPASGSPGGALIDLFSANEGAASLAIPPGTGWTVKSGTTSAFKFANRQAPAGGTPVRAAVLKQGRLLKVVARAAGLPLAGAQGAVGIRIVTGTRRSCALFDAATVRRDEAGKFSAKGALATSLADCSDGSLGATTTTTTATTSTSTTQPQPCGLIPDPFEPMCGGACPPGETCTSEFNSQLAIDCVCQAIGVTPCFGSGYPQCGGSCTGGRQCQAFHLLPGETPELTSCACVDPLFPCSGGPGMCFGIGACPPGQVCIGMGPPTSSCGCGGP